MEEKRINICTNRDSYVDNFFLRPEAIWIVKLSDNTVIFQDDGRKGLEPESAWLRLREHCELSKLKIVQMRLEFRSNKIRLPDDAEGYFFTKAAGAWLGQPSEYKYGVGILDNEEVKINYFLIPELVYTNESIRSKEECGECLIY